MAAAGPRSKSSPSKVCLAVSKVGQKQYVYTVYDRIFGEIPAITTSYIYGFG